MGKKFYSALSLVCLFMFANQYVNGENQFNQVFENGWPSFSISYPAGWIEKPSDSDNIVFMAESPDGMPSVTVSVFTNMNMPVEYSTRVAMPELKNTGKDVEVVSDKEIRLKNGTPAQESEYRMKTFTGKNLAIYSLTVKKGDSWVQILISDEQNKIKDNLKEIAYAINIEQEEDKPADIPADIKIFVDKIAGDLMGRDINKLMENYSDKWFHKGMNKLDFKPILNGLILAASSFKIIITKIDYRENESYNVNGYFLLNNYKMPYSETYIKEEGQWKCYGYMNTRQM